MKRPILILQIQRMGDLILSFPLFFWLSRIYPENPLWVVAEKAFFDGLIPISPQVVFFPATALNSLKGQRFELVINLSHRPEAAALAPHVNAGEWIGKRVSAKGETFIEGRWQLYRSSLTLNNRHNLFHWADLNALDVIPHEFMASTLWKPPRQLEKTGSGARVGLFLGASEEEKRPAPQFWADLALELMHKGLRPVFLGGPADKGIGAKAARLAGLPALNLTGRFTVPELVAFIRELHFLATPDTGPMHLAAWLGVPVLNLSMGPVNPWETGPYQPGHHVAQASMSCVGCWSCAKGFHTCKGKFNARSTAFLLRALSRSGGTGPVPSVHGLRIARTGKNEGLYFLNFQNKNTTRLALGNFWRHFFALHLGYKGSPGLGTENALQNASAALLHTAPRLVPAMRAGIRKLAGEFHARVIRGGTSLPEGSWTTYPPALRPLTGYIHPFLQNSDYSEDSRIQILKLLELLADSL